VGPRVGLGIPLFYQGQGAVDASRAEMRRQQDLTDATANQIRAEARALVTGVVNAQRAAVFYKHTLLPLKQEIVDETQLHYNGMSASGFELLAAKRSAIESARGYVVALRDYWTTRATLDLLLDGRLSRPLAHDFGLGVRTGGTGGE
jgi:cobalt-zinc-cadmium efflux system outer membrane protein